MKNKVLLIGVGPMAIAYTEVLQAMNVDFLPICRSEKSAIEFEAKSGIAAVYGGIDFFLKNNIQEKFSHAIVATGVESLAYSTRILLQYGVKHILLEKPGGKNIQEIEDLFSLSLQYDAQIFLAYNRRFYSSVAKAKEIIKEDGGILSMNFEFTEWGHIIEKLSKAEGVKENWFLANSTHVVDLAFYLGGKPKELFSLTSGGNSWHPSSSIFAGCGKTECEVIFTYQANWEAPGRWALEVLTKNHRLFFRPMEELSIQKLGNVAVNKVQIDDAIDKTFKPGLFMQVKNWIEGNNVALCSLSYQNDILPFYKKISNYQ